MGNETLRIELKDFIRAIPDFPKPGILFRDITPLLKSPEAFRLAIEKLCAPWYGREPNVIAGIEARGLIFGTAMAVNLGVPFVPVRKPGKLPWRTRRASYSLEYGSDAIEVHEDAVDPGQNVLIVDDLLATGGTMAAAVELFRGLGAEVVEALFLIELKALGGRARLPGVPLRTVLSY